MLLRRFFSVAALAATILLGIGKLAVAQLDASSNLENGVVAQGFLAKRRIAMERTGAGLAIGIEPPAARRSRLEDWGLADRARLAQSFELEATAPTEAAVSAETAAKVEPVDAPRAAERADKGESVLVRQGALPSALDKY